MCVCVCVSVTISSLVLVGFFLFFFLSFFLSLQGKNKQKGGLSVVDRVKDHTCLLSYCYPPPIYITVLGRSKEKAGGGGGRRSSQLRLSPR